MFKRLSHRDIPTDFQKLVADLRQHGDCVVFEDEKHRPIACLTPLPEADTSDDERQAWVRVSQSGLAEAYDDEPEYSLDLIKEPNPEYEGR
jgi:hypothetical protein